MKRPSQVDKPPYYAPVLTFKSPAPLEKPLLRKRLFPNVARLDLIVSLTYACGMTATTIPVILLPVIASDYATTSSIAASSFIAKVASFSTLGAAIGKFVNGFVCQAMGGKESARAYLLGLSASLLFLSQTTASYYYGPALACIELSFSMLHIAFMVLLADAYENSPPKNFSQAMTVLGLASTLSTLLTKLVGTTLLKYLHWRQVSQIGAVIALMGSAILHIFLRDKNTSQRKLRSRPKVRLVSVSAASILKSISNVLGSPIFWLVGFGHTVGMMARRSDQLLGGFFQAAADMPSYVCGGLTSFVTLGFFFGLVSSKQFQTLELDSQKKKFIHQRYMYASLSALGLALCAKLSVLGINKAVVVSMASIFSFVMASSVSFQIYQIPSLCAKLFGHDKAVCASFLDGIAYLLGAPIWLGCGHVISNYGWAAAWTMIASLLGLGGVSMLKGLPAVLEFQ